MASRGRPRKGTGKAPSQQRRVALTLRPGAAGTKKLLAEYGDRLFAVRYRYDAVWGRRLKTVEIIVDEGDWKPRGS